MKHIRRGPLLMIGASLGFTVMVVCVKRARVELPTAEVMAWRSAFSVPIVWLFARRRSGVRVHRRRLFALRVALGFTAMFCAFTAMKGLSVADLSFIWRLQPIFVALLAPLALGVAERAGWRLAVVLVAGLTGCAILLAPQLGRTGGYFGLWALCGAALGAAAHVTIRALSATESPPALVFWFQATVAALALVLSLATTGLDVFAVPLRLVPVLLGSAIGASAGQLLMTHAYWHDRAAVVSAAGYTGVVWAVLADLLAFRTVPTVATLVGGLLIVGSSAVLVLAPPARADPS